MRIEPKDAAVEAAHRREHAGSMEQAGVARGDERIGFVEKFTIQPHQRHADTIAKNTTSAQSFDLSELDRVHDFVAGQRIGNHHQPRAGIAPAAFLQPLKRVENRLFGIVAKGQKKRLDAPRQ